MKRSFAIILLILFSTLQFVAAQNPIIDSLKQALKTAKHDTTRCNILNQMVEEESDDELWPKYNLELKNIAEKNFQKNLPEQTKKIFGKHYAAALNNTGYEYATKGEMNTAIEAYLKGIAILKKINDKQNLILALQNLGNVYKKIGQSAIALNYYKESLKLCHKIKDKAGEANALYFIGYDYDNQGDITMALLYYDKSLKIQEQIDNKEGMALAINNIAYIYNNQGDVKTALEYYQKSLKINEAIGNKVGVASSLNNIGNIYFKHSENDKAFEYFNKSLKQFEAIQYNTGIAYTLNNIGNVYNAKNDFDNALEFYFKSLQIRKEIKDIQGVSLTNTNIGEIFYKEKNITEAEKYCLQGLKTAQEIGYPEGIKNASRLLTAIYEKQKKGLEALQMHKLYIQMRDSLNNIATQKAIITQSAKHAYETKAAEDNIRIAKEKKISALQLQQEKTLRYSLFIGLLLVIVFSVFVFNRFRITQRQKHIIEKQKEIVDDKRKEIVESITYAKRIQDAILPPDDFIKKHIDNYFIYYEPKDIVAGDFYWAEKIGDLFLIAAADSTGHGVPGAMVSVVCSNALNRAVKEFDLTETGKILDKTRELVLETFEKSTSEVKDGMDISLLCIDEKNKKITWSGANNPLWYIENDEFKEIKADKQPIGKADYPKPFTTNEINYSERTIFYLFTDGLADQFGGERGKKYKYKQFSDLLFSNKHSSMSEQNDIISKSFNDWKGKLEQVDDVCVIGIRL